MEKPENKITINDAATLEREISFNILTWVCTFNVLKIQDLEATIHKKDMELNDLNAR